MKFLRRNPIKWHIIQVQCWEVFLTFYRQTIGIPSGIDFEHVTLFDRWILQKSRLHAKHHLQKRKEESNLQLSRFQLPAGYTCISLLFILLFYSLLFMWLLHFIDIQYGNANFWTSVSACPIFSLPDGFLLLILSNIILQSPQSNHEFPTDQY